LSNEIVEIGRPWRFDGDGALFRLVAEAHRIRLAHLFDPLLAVHTSQVEPLPHQLTAVYEAMLPRQPLRFLLADDPGAGKTIMSGLLIRELIARGDLQRCLIVCPGSLAEQWQDELEQRFSLPFAILGNDKLAAAGTGNWFLENNLVIARLDKLARNEALQAKLALPDCRWDLIVCDEAHKLSAAFFGNEIKYTKRYRLGQLLSSLTRHFLLLTATPHNGKEEDFQLFMALLDGDRFEGRWRDGAHAVDVSDLMRRMVKEELLTFDGTPLFPERRASTLPYRLSPAEARLYREVTDYVRAEFNRAEALQNPGRAGTVGFALTILQRRLASSPEAIYQSLKRRWERLASRLRELELPQRPGQAAMQRHLPLLDADDIEELEEAPGDEDARAQMVDEATAARTIAELRVELARLGELERLALAVRQNGADKKWEELSTLLQSAAELFDSHRQRRKLVIFTEHRDTLHYLHERLVSLIGKPEAVLVIHGGLGRAARRKVQESFTHHPEVEILIATDAAGEGINLQRAHLMVNYDLPWNPNRLEQRFGRIHRIGQTEVCHLWNLVAEETREGDVYRRLLEKLEQARGALGGKVFDVLGKVFFAGRPLRELLIEAVRYGERPDVQARLHQVVDGALDRRQLENLYEERALVRDVMDASRVQAIRADMERAEARRLQPHYVQAFFLEAFARLGGRAVEKEPRRYEVRYVPAALRNRDRLTGEPVLERYERIVFAKDLVNVAGRPPAAFVCPGHPLLSATIDLMLERNRDLLRRGAVLVDECDFGEQPRVLFFLEHALQDARSTPSGERRIISRRLLFVEQDATGNARHLHYAPYLDYRPLGENELDVAGLLASSEFAWMARDLEQAALAYAVAQVVPGHWQEVHSRRQVLLDKTEAAVRERLSREIFYWERRAEELKLEEQAGKSNAKLNSQEARRRADLLEARLQSRLEELRLERQILSLAPVVLGGVLVIPAGLLGKFSGTAAPVAVDQAARLALAAKARAVVMDCERGLGFEPVDREADKLGYDIESRIPGTGRLRFIEVKARVAGAATITVTRNEILTALNKPESFLLAIVVFDGERVTPYYVREPFQREPDFGAVSVNYSLDELIARATPPA